MKRKPYERPAVIFEKQLEALADDCGGGSPNPNAYTGSGTTYCKTPATCTPYWNS